MNLNTLIKTIPGLIKVIPASGVLEHLGDDLPCDRWGSSVVITIGLLVFLEVVMIGASEVPWPIHLFVDTGDEHVNC